MWVQNLRTGLTATWNADARFPAASTVKIAVLVAALRRFGPRPELSRAAHELESLGAWSSNLAANRLLADLGGSSRGSSIAEEVLHRLGATSSTYPGTYRVGTSATAPPVAPNQPPLVSRRVTTAHDLAALLSELHAAASGDAEARRRTRLTQHEAQVGMNLLLSSQPTGDNVGLFRPWLGRGYPMAQKNGWLSSARHTAAVLFGSDGPRIVVLLTYRPGLQRADAATLGRQLVGVALRR
jgi:beta-lactamase class A